MEGVEHVQTSHSDLKAAVKAIYQSNWVGYACDEEKKKADSFQVCSHIGVLQACEHSKNKDSVLLISVGTGKYVIHCHFHGKVAIQCPTLTHVSVLGSV